MTTDLAKPLIAEAQERCTRLLLAEAALEEAYDSYFAQVWYFGQALQTLKEDRLLGFGNWELFIEGAFPALGRHPRKEQTAAQWQQARMRRVQLAMAFFRDNPSPNTTAPSFFSEASIRACIYRSAPEKERPLLAGNEPIARRPTPVTFCNELLKYRRHEQIGLATRPPLDVLRRDFAEPIRIIIDLVGADYIRELLGGDDKVTR